jgi:hypothetical protein
MTYIEKIVDAITGEETLKDYTPAQIAEAEAAVADAAKRAEELAKVAANKEAAQAKLAALGLTTDDLKALGL